MSRYLGLDVGDKTIGIALSDEMFLTAQGVTTIFRKGIKTDLSQLEEIIDSKEVTKIIVGLPKNMDNTIGYQGEKVLKFIEKLKKRLYSKDIVIETVDERLSTVSAENILLTDDVRRDRRKQVIDKVAATIILQLYLDMKEKE